MVRWAKGALLDAIAIDRAAPHRLSIQITAGLRTLILEGTLPAGERLPATRILSREFGVSRATIVESFERLHAEGLVETRVGAGTYVAAGVHAERPHAPATRRTVDLAAPAIATAKPLVRLGSRLAHDPRPFTTAMPAFDEFPMAQWARLSAKHWRQARAHVLGYPDPVGFAPLRQAIAAHLRANRGIDCEASEVFVVAGAQQAFQLVADMLLHPGDKVWFEDPGAIGARNTFIMAGADLVPVPVDENGLDVEAGLALAPDFRLAFVTPAHQQPLGVKMGFERRVALLSAADRADAFIIEDDWDGEFSFTGRPLPPLRSLDQAGRVIYVGTFSKSLFPSIRLGFVLAPPALRPHLQAMLSAFSPGTPTALQAIVADFIAEGHFATHIRRMRKLYSERHAALQASAKRHLSRWIEVVPTDTGLHTIGWLKPGITAGTVERAAAGIGLNLAPLARFSMQEGGREGVVMGFSGFSPVQIEAAAAQLAGALAALPVEV